MISPETADFFRYAYALLAIATCVGFTMTLVLRWEVLGKGERLLRLGLIAEHTVIIYGAYVALGRNFPPTMVGALMTLSLLVVVLGFVVWLRELASSRIE